jgi:hypothetical protein
MDTANSESHLKSLSNINWATEEDIVVHIHLIVDIIHWVHRHDVTIADGNHSNLTSLHKFLSNLRRQMREKRERNANKPADSSELS